MKINTAALALLAASAAALPLSTINATLSAVNATGSPFANATATATGPGESVEACVMPDGCRDEKKHNGAFGPPHTTGPHVSSTKTRYVFEPGPLDVPPATTTTAEPTSSSRPSSGDRITSILLPGDSASSVSTETITTDTRGFLPLPTVLV